MAFGSCRGGRLRFRLLDSGPGSPALNMATDEVLLRSAGERPTLRLYAWDPPAISLGYFQRACEAPRTTMSTDPTWMRSPLDKGRVVPRTMMPPTLVPLRLPRSSRTSPAPCRAMRA